MALAEDYVPIYPNEPFDPSDGGRPYDRRQRPRKRFNRVRLSDIMKMEFDPLRWAIEDYLAEGLSVLAGRQKLGKTWLALDWAIAVATGGVAMGSIPVDQGDVLYIDLENGHRRVQRRIDTLFPSFRDRPDVSRLEIVTESPQLDEGFIAELDAWRKSVRLPKLVVIDVLQRIKPAGKAARNSYENDYSIMAELQQWATGHGIAVVALHHTRKGGAEDPLEALSGSNGLSACADATLVLDRNSEGTSLYVRGRDVEEKDTAIRFDGGMWSILGEAAAVRRSSERNSIMAALEASSSPMSPTEIADVTGQSNAAVRKALGRMVAAGEIEKAGRGSYQRCDAKNQGAGHNRHNVTKDPKFPEDWDLEAPDNVTPIVTPFRQDLPVTSVVTIAEPDKTGVPEANVTDVTVVTGGSDVTTEREEDTPKSGPGVTITGKKTYRVSDAEYDAHVDMLIKNAKSEKEASELRRKQSKGMVIQRGDDMIFVMGRL